MLTISQNGVDLSAEPPALRTLTATNSVAVYRLQARIEEDNDLLPVQNVGAVVLWNDGGVSSTLTGVGSVDIDESRSLPPGDYLIQLLAGNYILGSPKSVVATFPVRVLPAIQLANPKPLIYGPILPRDNGFPGAKDWLYDTSQDIFVLESSAKMLLSTAKGERIMEPEYGTNIRRLIFESTTAALEATIQQEIVDALAAWEPRLDLQFLQVETEPNTRTVIVAVTLVSKLTNRTFMLTLNFQPY